MKTIASSNCSIRCRLSIRATKADFYSNGRRRMLASPVKPCIRGRITSQPETRIQILDRTLLQACNIRMPITLQIRKVSERQLCQMHWPPQGVRQTSTRTSCQRTSMEEPSIIITCIATNHLWSSCRTRSLRCLTHHSNTRLALRGELSPRPCSRTISMLPPPKFHRDQA